MEHKPGEMPDIEAMRLGVDYRFPITCRSFTVYVRPLTHQEMVKAAQEVGAEMARMPKSAQTPITEHSLLSKYILSKATTSDVGKTDYELTEPILDRMTPEELTHLFKQYVGNTDRCNPSLDAMSIEEVKELVEMVKKNPQQAIGCSFFQLVNMVRYLLTNDG